jgi:hexulose-6-phosphate isomerase
MDDSYLRAYADSGLYVMQGRLSAPEGGYFQCFPRSSWKSEIALMRDVPLRGVEWIYDHYGEGSNPLKTELGRLELRNTLKHHGVEIRSVCADYFMDFPLHHPKPELRTLSYSRLSWLIEVCSCMNIERVVLPFVDQSRLANTEEKYRVIRILSDLLPVARAYQVELHLETDLGPSDFRDFLRDIDDPRVKVNYDAGNSSSLGYRPAEEFAAYGERIGSFHIKDRVFGGGTVPIGEGDTDFITLRSMLIEVKYRGDFVLQVARSAPGGELSWLRRMNSRACRWLRGQDLLAEKS